MSKLGGTKVSEDTDRDSAGTVTSVNAGTNVTITGTSTDPVVNASAAGGQVDSVVAGTNITSIDNTDPANPIINAATQAGDPSPLTTKGDVYVFDTDDQRLAVGTDGQVLTADSAEPTGLKYATPAAGVAVTTPTVTMQNAEPSHTPSFSGSANATKGTVYDVDTTFTVFNIAAETEGDATATYKCIIAEVSGATNVIDVVLATSSTQALNTTQSLRVFTFAGGVELTAGKRVAMLIVRDDGTGASVCKVNFPGILRTKLPPFLTFFSYTVTADNAPVATTVLGAGGTANVVALGISGSSLSTPTTASTELELSAFFQGVMANSEKLATYVVGRIFTLPSALADSQAYAEVVSTAAATFDVQVNDVSKGSINFALGASTATFTFASAVVLAVGDRIQLIAQASADATLADVAVTLRGTL